MCKYIKDTIHYLKSAKEYEREYMRINYNRLLPVAIILYIFEWIIFYFNEYYFDIGMIVLIFQIYSTLLLPLIFYAYKRFQFLSIIKLKLISNLYLLGAIAFGAFVVYATHNEADLLHVFLMMVLATGALFYMPPKESLFVIVLPTIIFLVGLVIYEYNLEIIHVVVTNTLIFIFIVYIMSINLFVLKIKDLNFQMMIGREAYLQALVNSLDDAVFEVDENGVVKNFRTNDPYIIDRVFPDGSRDRTTLETFMSRSEAEEYITVARNVIKTGKSATVEFATETPRGMRWFLVRISLITDTSIVAVSARDITERKDMERNLVKARLEAEEANRAKSQFLSNMSHELRTPLNAVLGFAQVLEIDYESPLSESQQECVYEIKKAGAHLLELINEVLDLAKIESGRIAISIKSIKLAQIVEETVALVKPMADKYGVELVSDYNQCDRYVKTDKIRMKQILINLINNAIKYNKENGKVTYYCEPIEGYVRFHIIDTGIGIPEDQLEDIFKPFNRVDNSKNLVEGTGIGLAVVKQLIKLMDGDIHVESTLGEGSHFYFDIPEAPIDEQNCNNSWIYLEGL